MGNEIAKKKPVTNLQRIDAALSDDIVVEKFKKVLGKNAASFTASVFSAVQANPGLQRCEPNSIITAAYEATAYNLPIEQNFGYAAIVPYKVAKKDENGKTIYENGHKVYVDRAQFQMMYRGYIQLAIRSGMYKKIICTEIYEDEIIKISPIREEYYFMDGVSPMRDEGNIENVVGYYASLELLSGFRKEIYMTKDQVEAHARRYSQSYRNDIEKGWTLSKWTTDFNDMAKKTVIKQLITKWGAMTTEMQQAVIQDQKIYDEDGEGAYDDNMPDIVEAEDAFAAAEIEQKRNDEDVPQEVKAEEVVPETNVSDEKSVDDEYAAFEAAYARA